MKFKKDGSPDGRSTAKGKVGRPSKGYKCLRFQLTIPEVIEKEFRKAATELAVKLRAKHNVL
jgi:hypothetical protein